MKTRLSSSLSRASFAMLSILVRQPHGDRGLGVVDVERAACRNQLHKLRALVVGLPHVERHGHPLGRPQETLRLFDGQGARVGTFNADFDACGWLQRGVLVLDRISKKLVQDCWAPN